VTARLALDALAAARQHGFRSGLEPGFAAPLCARMDRDALVASPDPWQVYQACGNAGWTLPRDLDTPAVLARYLAEQAPGYLIAPQDDASRYEASPRLARVAVERGHVLFALRDAPPGSRPWRAPPPLPR
jgi:hypothetical protein